MSVSMSAWLTSQCNCTRLPTSISTPWVCQVAWLACYDNQHIGQKWVQLLCTQIWMFTVVLTPRFVYFRLVCHQMFPPLGCVRLTDLHVIYQRIGQNGCNCHALRSGCFTIALTPKFVSLYLYYLVPLPFILWKIHRLVFCLKNICLEKGEKGPPSLERLHLSHPQPPSTSGGALVFIYVTSACANP